MLDELSTGQYFALPILAGMLALALFASKADRLKRSLVRARQNKRRDEMNAR